MFGFAGPIGVFALQAPPPMFNDHILSCERYIGLFILNSSAFTSPAQQTALLWTPGSRLGAATRAISWSSCSTTRLYRRLQAQVRQPLMLQSSGFRPDQLSTRDMFMRVINHSLSQLSTDYGVGRRTPKGESADRSNLCVGMTC